MLKFGYRDKFIRKIEVAYTKIKSKIEKMVSYLNLLRLYEEFPRGVHSHTVIYYCS